MTKVLLLVLGLGVLLTPPTWAQPIPLPIIRSCEAERDHLRVLLKMVADGRGSAEWALAESLAKQQRLEAEVNRLRDELTTLKKPSPPKEEKP